MTAGIKRTVFWLVVLGLLAAGIGWSLRPRPVPVDMVPASLESLVVTVDEEGRTRVREVFVVSAPVMGRVRRSALEVGDAVEAGVTVVAEIEPSDPAFLDVRARAEAEADVAGAEDALVRAEAEVDVAKAELDYARAELERARRLAGTGAISGQAADEALRVFRTRSASLTTAQAAVRVAEHTLERARSRLAIPVASASHGKDCDCVVLRAPVSGRVLQVHQESESVVAPAQPLVSIGDPHDLEIVAEMLSTEAVKVKPGMRVIVDGWGGETPLAGEVQRIEPFGFTKVSALGIEEQRVNVVVELRGDPATWQALGHGFRVDVRVVVWETDTALVVPLTALFRVDGGWALFVAQDGVARRREVDIGERAGMRVQVTSGLEPGERVVVSPSDSVEDGRRVSGRAG